ncbi:hypothetical protein APHAL10511_007754 [Amanita phalloides]|nr:hypothetical protein APHAL10511_007754 [Amanita phalloides]
MVSPKQSRKRTRVSSTLCYSSALSLHGPGESGRSSAYRPTNVPTVRGRRLEDQSKKIRSKPRADLHGRCHRLVAILQTMAAYDIGSNEGLLTVMVNHLLLVEHVDILIGALVGFVILLRLPRALARLWKRSEWLDGHFLRYSARKVQVPPTLRSSCPPHIPAYPAFLRPIVGPLGQSIAFGYSNLQILVMLAYLAIMLYAFSYHSNFLSTPVRPAYIAVAQLPFLYAFAAKNSVPGSLLGMGYQTLNFFHRYIGRLVVLAANVHAIGFLYRWTNNNTIRSAFRKRSNRWGLVVLIFLDIVLVFSTSYWRKRAYNVFRFTHFVGYLFIIPALYFHKPASLPFIIGASLIYLIDRVLCLLKARLVTAVISPIPNLEATRIEVPSLNCGWRAGQHVRLRVLSTSLGWLGWMEPHPFTIASAPAHLNGVVGDEGLVFICKKAGGWTSRLFDMAKSSPQNEPGADSAGSSNRSVKVLIEGPYGGPGHAIFTSYSAVVLVIGGSGITFALSTIQDMVQKDLRGESSVKVIELVWTVPNPDAMTPLLSVFTPLLKSCPYLTISLHYTRPYIPSTAKTTLDSSTLANTREESYVVPQGLAITAHPGRPGRKHLMSVIENVITRATNSASGTTETFSQRGLLVGVCGPRGMGQDVCVAVADIDPKMVGRIGGIEMHHECFEF